MPNDIKQVLKFEASRVLSKTYHLVLSFEFLNLDVRIGPVF